MTDTSELANAITALDTLGRAAKTFLTELVSVIDQYFISEGLDPLSSPKEEGKETSITVDQ